MPNRLAQSASPYLLQHADQPVDWEPWDDQALSRARTEDRPILLSIGYSACHWCHVMAHESFDDPELAEKMNAWFVNIKVDREERPDLDRIYQLSHQLLTGRPGGWPLTVFLNPTDLVAFAAGTYFPPAPRGGLPGFGEVLERVHQAWLQQRDRLSAQNEKMRNALELIHNRREPARAGPAEIAAGLIDQLNSRFDRRHGGFGQGSKFPQPPLLDFLLGAAEHDREARSMLLDTLHAMVRFGLHDHLGGGFFRYCVDSAWEIPHFEKMLLDNAQLVGILAEAGRRFDDRTLIRAAEAVVAFLERDMSLPEGGLATSLDADSLPEQAGPDDPPEEGEVYLWTPAQVGELLPPDDAELVCARFGLDGPPNFRGRWHLIIARGLGELVTADTSAETLIRRLDTACGRLLDRRRQRPQPFRDEKRLAGPNALAVLGVFRAGRLLGRPEWIRTAHRWLQILLDEHFDRDPAAGSLYKGRFGASALLDDHAAVLLALLESLQLDWNGAHLERAVRMAETIRERFAEKPSGRLYLSPREPQGLPVRPTAASDENGPAGVASMVRAWRRLADLTGEPEWLDHAHRALAHELGAAAQEPVAHASLIAAAQELEQPPVKVLLWGPDTPVAEWHRRLLARTGVEVYRPAGALPASSPLAAPETDLPAAMVCQGQHCLALQHDWDGLIAALESVSRP
ncbi:MAG: thioredoxin domain-containing protein [Wenzhouxiangellaceae bacterium]